MYGYLTYMNPSLALEQLPVAALLLDLNGYICYANKQACLLTGYAPDLVNGRHIGKLYPGNDIVKADYELAQTSRNKQFAIEGWRLSADGNEFWSDCLVGLYNDESGKHTGYLYTINSAWERKKKVLQAEASAERYRLMVEEVRDYSIFLLDKDGYIQTWNEGAKLINGYQTAEIIGKHFSTFYTLEDLENKKPERELSIAVATGKYEEEGWRVKKNGSLFWANVVITALFNTNNQHVGFSKVTRDLTDRRLSEEYLRQSEERYRLLVEQVGDYGIFMLDEKGRITSWNAGAKKINGYEATEIIGKYFSIFYPQEDILNGKPANELKVAIATGKYEEEGWRIRKDGSRFWANIVITAVYNNGVHIGFSKVTRDLTEKITLEKEIKHSAEKYKELSQELQIRNDALEATNKELEQFTSIASHDLQEPLRSIKSYLKLIEAELKETGSEQVRNYIAKTVGAANRMRELIINLLQYAQVGKVEITRTNNPAKPLLATVLQNLKQAIASKNASVNTNLKAETVFADEIQLQQLLQNLISNALKFCDRAQPRVDISSWQENDEVIFRITDNGIGIAEDNLAKVFDIFKRLHARSHYPGTGIGLAICKRIVERHHGRIWVESTVGQGSSFYFSIPKMNGHEAV